MVKCYDIKMVLLAFESFTTSLIKPEATNQQQKNNRLFGHNKRAIAKYTAFGVEVIFIFFVVFQPWRDHWMQAVYYPIRTPDVQAGQDLALISNHDEYSLWFDVATENLRLTFIHL